MKDIYYADNGDVVKWAGLLHLCRLVHAKNVIQVAYYRTLTSKETEGRTMLFDQMEVTIPKQIVEHFRNLQDIRRLRDSTGIKILVFSDEFDHVQRVAYHEAVCRKIRAMKSTKVVLLDPDTGIALRQLTPRHVGMTEIMKIWQSLGHKDALALYQHRHRFRPEAEWLSKTVKGFAKACQIDERRVGAWKSDLAKDVVFFYATKRQDLP